VGPSVGVVVGLLWACGGRIDRREDDGMAGRDGNEVGGAANTHAADGASVGLGADVSPQIERGLQWGWWGLRWGWWWGWWWGGCGFVGRRHGREGGKGGRQRTQPLGHLPQWT